ncbi:MAG TPA: aminotransferase class V-fold PLP-dependent enzyme [Cyclobacteriaceae bacterium]
MDRRKFLQNSGFAMGAGFVLPVLSCTPSTANTSEENKKDLSLDSWTGVRNQFNLTPDRIHMSQMLLASHPKPVREAIEKHRKNFDENPFEYWENNWIEAEKIVTKAAGHYIKADPAEIVLTDSTTMGLAVLYSGLKLKPGNEILTTTHDHYSTEKSLEFASKKNGASIKRISLYTDPSTVTADSLTDALIKGITPATRIIAVTWVHSVTGVKLPIRKMADAIKVVNEKRAEVDRIIFCVDGVHGFGVENITMEDLGCDFFVAGTHKWIFGPRGTGILWGKKELWNMVAPTIPAFRETPYSMWMGVIPEGEISFTDLCSPGGFLAFEHRWSLNEAFDFQMKIGKARVEERTHQLSTMLKNGLKEMKKVKLLTPIDPVLSSGINCFEVEGKTPEQVRLKLLEKKILASTTPYKEVHARLTPSVINTEEEVQACLNVLKELAA